MLALVPWLFFSLWSYKAGEYTNSYARKRVLTKICIQKSSRSTPPTARKRGWITIPFSCGRQTLREFQWPPISAFSWPSHTCFMWVGCERSCTYFDFWRTKVHNRIRERVIDCPLGNDKCSRIDPPYLWITYRKGRTGCPAASSGGWWMDWLEEDSCKRPLG